MRNLILLVCVFLFSACSTRVEYIPSKMTGFDESSKTVRELLLMQYKKFKPSDVMISDTSIKFDYVSSIVTDKWKSPTVHYQYIKSSKLQQHGSWYNVHILDKNNRDIGQIYHSEDINKAKLFMNAFETLITSGNS